MPWWKRIHRQPWLGIGLTVTISLMDLCTTKENILDQPFVFLIILDFKIYSLWGVCGGYVGWYTPVSAGFHGVQKRAADQLQLQLQKFVNSKTVFGHSVRVSGALNYWELSLVTHVKYWLCSLEFGTLTHIRTYIYVCMYVCVYIHICTISHYLPTEPFLWLNQLIYLPNPMS